MMILKAVAHWKLKWVTILYQKKYQNGTKIGRFFCLRGGGGSMENVKYVP